ncbi:HlyD family type I secretion periplasmic adaptor subunit [Piscinibacter sakaiensis]|uniref:HlyD family type I secretion periplasmic adaptor subunit n=1 Tax=Piscinibacter sakaiensis TaxID=1547922 RepID=UPI003AAC20B8
MAITICSLFLIAVLWAVFGQIDIVAVAPGRIVVSDNTKTLQPLEAGVVRRVLVKDGDLVSAGQLLVELDSTQADADGASIAEQLAAASSERRRSDALIDALADNRAPVLRRSDAGNGGDAMDGARLAAEWGEINAKRARLDAEVARRQAELVTLREAIRKLETTLPLARRREADFSTLAAQGFLSGHAGQDRTRERVELEADLATQRARLNEVQAALKEAVQAGSAFLAETRRVLSERHAAALSKQVQLTQEKNKTERRSRLASLRAPVDGTVQQVAVHTEGGVVTPAQVLMVIVPKDAPLTAKVIIDNKDIGFVHVGQAAQIKLETFPFTRYGTVPAVVSSLAADAVHDDKRGALFPATLALQNAHIDVDGKRIALGAGMTLSAELKTGKRRVIDYLLSPVRRTIDESLGER